MNKPKKSLLKIKISSLLLGIFAGDILVYQWWDRKQKLEKLQTRLSKLERLKNQAQRQYQLQEINFISTNDLVNNSEVHSFFTVF